MHRRAMRLLSNDCPWGEASLVGIVMTVLHESNGRKDLEGYRTGLQ